MDVVPTCGCDRGVTRCSISDSTKAYPIAFLELYELIFFVGFVMIINAILLNSVLDPISKIVNDADKQSLDGAKNISVIFSIGGAVLLIIGITSYFYHRSIKS